MRERGGGSSHDAPNGGESGLRSIDLFLPTICSRAQEKNAVKDLASVGIDESGRVLFPLFWVGMRRV
jgi:hypothetical protein